VFDARSVAAAFGISVEIADLGDWDAATLVAEYDPRALAIRINERALDRCRRACGALDSDDLRAFIDLAIAHELYHHREAIGDVSRLAHRAQREAAADRYARANVRVGAGLAAFIDAETVR
jgi:hypothetical protein